MSKFMNVYWTIRYKNGWLDNYCRYTRNDTIKAYLDSYKNSPLYSDKSWAWHKYNRGVRAVRVEIVITDQSRVRAKVLGNVAGVARERLLRHT